MAGDPVLVAGMTDPDPNAAKIWAEMLVDRAQSVVARRPAALFDLDLERGKIELVVKNRQAFRAKFVESQRLGHAAPAFVHESRRLDQQHLVPTDPPFLHPGLELLLHRAKAMHVAHDIGGHDTDIVDRKSDV